MLVFSTYLKKETMKEVKQFFSAQIKSICLLFTIVVGGFLTLSSCSPACDEGNYLGTVEECSVTADATASGGGSGGSSGGSTGGGGDTTAPTVQSVTPANSATSIAVADNITVTFSEAMQSSTVDNTTITLTDSGTTVPTTVSYSNNVATINPNVVNGGLLWNTQYTINVSTGVKDAAGNALASAYSSSFTTAVLPIPTNFTATADNASRISVAWDAMPGVSNYKVTYGTVSSSCCFTTASSPSNNMHAFNGLSSSTTYYLKVRSQNGTGTTFQWGDWSNVVTVTTP
jgi:hypothetical protein